MKNKNDMKYIERHIDGAIANHMLGQGQLLKDLKAVWDSLYSKAGDKICQEQWELYLKKKGYKHD